MVNFKIYYYLQSSSKKNPVKIFIDSLDNRTKGKVKYLFDLLQEYGFTLGLPYTKKIKSTDLWELRVISNKSVRIFYTKYSSKVFIMLHGFIKKSQKTPRKHLRIALSRLSKL